MNVNRITQRVIGAAIEVHRILGPGLLERAYQTALIREFQLQHISFESQKRLAMTYKGVTLPQSYQIDLLVENLVVVEIKAVETLRPIHEAQLLTYLKLGRYQVGLLLNFNVAVLTRGIVRRVLGLEE